MKKLSIVVIPILFLLVSVGAIADEPVAQPAVYSTVESVTDALVGVWLADMTTIETNMLDGMSQEEQQQVLAMLSQGAMRLTNNADGTSSTFAFDPASGEEYLQTGTWQVVGLDGNNVSVQTTEVTDSRGAHEIDVEPETQVIVVVDTNTLIFSKIDGDQYIRLSIVRQ